MGLDQYANWTGTTTNDDGSLIQTEFKYWRKRSHIQAFFQKVYAEQTGDTDPSNFNCVGVEITQEVLNKFVDAVKNRQLQTTDGFFFGASYDTTDPDVVSDDLEFASECQMHLWLGHKVIYSSWW